MYVISNAFLAQNKKFTLSTLTCPTSDILNIYTLSQGIFCRKFRYLHRNLFFNYKKDANFFKPAEFSNRNNIDNFNVLICQSFKSNKFHQNV